MFKISAIPAFKDNYIWAIHDSESAVIVDPGDASPVLAFLSKHNLKLIAILCTHRHNDHIGGIEILCKEYHVPVYGRSHPMNPYITHNLQEGSQLTIHNFDLNFKIFEIPGHLDDHIAFFNPEILLCGDVLFGAGCGRNKEGSIIKLYDSLQRLSRLPPSTPIYCAHEYTAENIRFALICEPNNVALKERAITTNQLRILNLPTLPSTIALENATNPFLRCTSIEIIDTLSQRGLGNTDEHSVFVALREWRNNFNSKQN
jgi:hydroxyacylglutathione hydrolase